MLPMGSPSWSEISWYGTGGSHQHLKQALPAPGQPSERLADDLRALAGENALVDLGLVVGNALQLAVLLAEHHPLTRRQVAQALVPRRRGQPRAHAIGVLDAVNVLKQPQPGRLGHVRGIALPELEVRGNVPDQPGKLINEAFPRLVISVRGVAYQRRDTRSIAI